MAVNDSVTQNLLPVQAYFDVYGNFQTFIGQGVPFYALINPNQSGLTITNSTIDSTIIGGTSPSTATFTNLLTITGQVSTGPVATTDIANKLYVDTVAQGLSPKGACKVATLTNITLSGLQTIDGYSVLAGNRVLVKNQTNAPDNGIYIASTGAWTRSLDMDVWAEVPSAYTVVLNGSQSDTGWVSTSADTGTIGTTPITFVQFSGSATYFAGTGLTLASNTFSISNTTVTSGSYGSSSNTLLATVNAQGQLTAISATPISITNAQVSGLGTISTQNANSITITGGSINGTTIGNSTASAIVGTTITANTGFTGNGSGLTGTATSLNIGGNASTATTATTATSVSNALTFNNLGTGATSGTTFNGSTAQTISYNTLGAPSVSGTNATGTWGISITGNSATVTNGLYSSSSYSNPTWLTSILGSIVSGAVSLATSATNLSGGSAGALAYQSGSGASTFLTLGTTNYVLTAGATAPQYVAQSTLSVGSATTATTATNLAGGAASQLVYQSANGATGFIANGTSGQFLTSNGSGVPSWATVSTAVTITDQTSSTSTFYPLFWSATSGTTNTVDTSSTKLQYVPSTGTLSSTVLSGGALIATETITGALSAGAVSYGTLGYSDIDIFESYTINANAYAQSILQNTGSGTASSADFIISNNLGTASTYYGDFGITSSAYNTPGQNIVNAPSTVYLQSVTTPLAIGTLNAYALSFYTNSTLVASFNSTGAFGVGSTPSYGTAGQVLQSNGSTAAPTWVASTGGLTITDDTSTNATRYITFTSATSGTITSENTSSTKLQYNPSTGVLTSTSFAGIGAFSTLSATGVFTASAGTSALPSIVTASGSTTGLFSSTANVLGFAVSATQVGTVTSTGLNAMAVGATTASTGAFTTLSANSTVTFSGTTTNIAATSQTSGLITIGGTAGTGALTFGSSTASQTTNIANGVTASAATNTINIGTAGASGSTTTLKIGSTLNTSTTLLNGVVSFQNASATLANLSAGATIYTLNTFGGFI